MPKRIMVINDTQAILELYENLLTDEGYEVYLASFGIDEMKDIERVLPDLLILDYTVGDERNGWQLLQKLKMVTATASIPVIICTTAIKLAEEIEGYLYAKNIITVRKPFDIADLLTAVTQTLEKTVSQPHDAHNDGAGKDP